MEQKGYLIRPTSGPIKAVAILPGVVMAYTALKSQGAERDEGQQWLTPYLADETIALSEIANRGYTIERARAAGELQKKLRTLPVITNTPLLRDALREVVYSIGELIWKNSKSMSAAQVASLTGQPVENFKTKSDLTNSVKTFVNDLAKSAGKQAKFLEANLGGLVTKVGLLGLGLVLLNKVLK